MVLPDNVKYCVVLISNFLHIFFTQNYSTQDRDTSYMSSPDLSLHPTIGFWVRLVQKVREDAAGGNGEEEEEVVVVCGGGGTRMVH